MEKIIFFGTNYFAVPSLQKLAEIFDISLVVTKPAKPVGRKQTLSPNPIEVTAKALKLNIISPLQLDKNTTNKLKNLNPDLFVVIDYGKIIPQKILDIPKKGAINIHPSELPKYRGATPIQTAILNGEKETAISIMLIDEKMDHGQILAQKKINILDNDTYKSLYSRLGELAPKLLVETIKKYLSGQIKPQEQNHNEATFTEILKRKDGEIDWNKPAEKIEQMVRAFDPWPGTFTRITALNKTIGYPITNGALQKSKRLKILKVSISLKNRSDKHLGQFFKTPKGKLAVACGQNTTLLINNLQPEGKKPMTGEEFIQGYIKE